MTSIVGSKMAEAGLVFDTATKLTAFGRLCFNSFRLWAILMATKVLKSSVFLAIGLPDYHDIVLFSPCAPRAL